MTRRSVQNEACRRRRPVWALLTPLLLAGCADRELLSRDLLDELRAASRIEEPTLIDVGTVPARSWLGMGWSVDETTPPEAALAGDRSFVWATGDASELVLPLLEPRPLELVLGLRPFWWPDAEPLGLELSINGHALPRQSLVAGDHAIRLSVSSDYLLEGDNRLRIEPSRSPVAASVLPQTGELRRLTVGLFHVALLRPGEAVPSTAVPTAAGDGAAGCCTDEPGEARTFGVGPGSDGPPDGTGPLPPVPAAELRAPGEISWRLRVRDQSVLEYDLELVSGKGASVQLQWIAEGEVEGLAAQRVAAGWLDRQRVSGSIELPSGTGRLRVRVLGDAPREPVVVRIRSMRLSFPPPPRPLHVLWITLDTFRADHLGAYGHPQIHTPVLDRLARRGIVLSELHSQIPITGPSHASLFTGRYPLTHSVRNNGQALALEEETLAEVLKAYGWHTGAVVSLVVLHSNLHFSQGFDRFENCPAVPWWRTAPEVTDVALDLLDLQWPEQPFFLWAHYSDSHEPYAPPGSRRVPVDLDLDGEPLATYHVGDGGVLRQTVRLRPGTNRLRFLARPAPGDAFLGAIVRYLSFDSPLVLVRYGEGFSGPNANGFYRLDASGTVIVELAGGAAQDVSLTMWAVEQLGIPESLQRYAQEVELMDREIGRLLAGLEQRGMADRTLIVVTNDHGEGLWNHGQPGHVEQLYREALHSPGLFVLPGSIQSGVRSDAAEHVDVLPTVLELLGLPPKPDAQGSSLALGSPAPGNTSQAPAQPAPPGALFFQTFPPEATADRRAVVLDGWKLIRSNQAGRRELFDTAADPAERVDRSAEHPELLERMTQRLEQLERDARAAPGARSEAAQPSVVSQEQMKALGYVGHDD